MVYDPAGATSAGFALIAFSCLWKHSSNYSTYKRQIWTPLPVSTSPKCLMPTNAICSKPFRTRCKRSRFKNVYSFPNLSSSCRSLHTDVRVWKIAVHNLTDICFSKCVTGKISSAKLERAEESCAQNCVERFLDANESVIRHLEAMRSQS